MSDLIYYKNGEETFRISPPTVGTKTPKTKLEVKKMTEIEKTKQEIEVLTAKLELLKEMENHITPCEEAYKRVYGFYPETYEDSWSAFQDGFFEGCKVEEPDESVEEYLKPHTPEKTEQLLREAFKKVQQTEEWKETQRKIDGNYDELVESETSPPKPTSSVFRQKLFDGIKSVFYDPDYERTHWKMKVDMAVDEVMTHFYDILPEPEEYIGVIGPSQGYVDGWNHYHKIIKEKLE